MSSRPLSIMQLFGVDNPRWTAEEIAAALGDPVSSVYRSLRQLKSEGFLTSFGGGYYLGPKIIELDYVARLREPFVIWLENLDIADYFSVPVSLVLVRNYGARLICIHARRSGDAPRTAYVRGKPMNLIPGAIGRSLLCHYTRGELLEVCRANTAALARLGWGDAPEKQASAIASLRKDPVQVAFGEVNPGVVGIAKAIGRGKDRPTASLCATVTGSLIATPSILQEVTNGVVRIVEELEKLSNSEKQR